jgi:hypothetical protein
MAALAEIPVPPGGEVVCTYREGAEFGLGIAAPGSAEDLRISYQRALQEHGWRVAPMSEERGRTYGGYGGPVYCRSPHGPTLRLFVLTLPERGNSYVGIGMGGFLKGECTGLPWSAWQ